MKRELAYLLIATPTPPPPPLKKIGLPFNRRDCLQFSFFCTLVAGSNPSRSQVEFSACPAWYTDTLV